MFLIFLSSIGGFGCASKPCSRNYAEHRNLHDGVTQGISSAVLGEVGTDLFFLVVYIFS